MVGWQFESKSLAELDLLLCLILPFPILIGSGARLVRLEEQNLTQTFIGEDANRIRRRIRNRYGHKSFPLRLERCDVHENSRTRVGRFTHAEGQDIARDPEILNSPA